MTNEDQVAALFAKANPVPTLDLLDPVEVLDIERLAHPSARSSEMTEVKVDQTKSEGPGRKPRLALGLAMAVVAVVAVGILVRTESGVASPVSVATAFMDANAEHDVDAMWELLAPDSEAKVAGLAAMTAAADWSRAVGWAEIGHQACEEKSNGPDGTVVACPFIRQTDWILALGLEPVTNNIYDILVVEGQIQSVVETDNGEPSSDGMMEASGTFRRWVVENHPDDIGTMYEGDSWQNSPEAIALYEQYTDEFVAEMEIASPESIGDAFMNAYADHDGNAALELMAEDARYLGLSPLSNLPLALDLDGALGEDITNKGCEVISTDSSGTLVACPFTFEGDVPRALGIEPASVTYTIRVDEGQIQSVDRTCCEDAPGVEDAWVTFRDWVEENHPDDFETMYNGEGGAHLNPESIALYEQYTDAFVASLEG